MRYKILGKTGLEVSELAFGAIQLTRIEEKEAIDLVRMANIEGINLIDTAHDYFNSEEILGKALKNIRKDMHIITKSSSKDKKEFLGDLDTSLKRLKTEYIDVYLFHSVSNTTELDEVVANGLVDALIKEKKKGKIGNIGFSCHNPKVVQRFFEIEDFSVLMIPLNFITTEYVEKELYERFMENDIGLLAMKPFGGGRLSDIELCFKFLRLYPEVITVAGMQSIKELKQNMELVEKDDIPDKHDYKKIKKISEELGSRFCRQCGYCMPCEEKGIDIINVNFIEVYYKQFPMDEFWKLGLEEKVETARECIECGNCSVKCPFELDVPKIIKHNVAFYESLRNYGK